MTQALNDRDLEKVVGGRISKDEALTLAMEHAKVTKEQIHYKHVERDLEDGIMIYDISFVCNGIECEYDVDAETGEILSIEMDYWD